MSRSDSPKRRRQEKSEELAPVCRDAGKLAYNTKKRALTAMNHSRAHPVGTLRPVAVYKCRHCKRWHLTKRQQVAA